MFPSSSKRVLLCTVLTGLFLSACSMPLGLGATPTPAYTPTLTLTPTTTPLPMALTVNGEGIPVTEFDAAVARYTQAESALGHTVDKKTAAQTVGQDLIDTLLLGQGAAAAGQTVDDSAVQARIDALAAQVGGTGALSAWESAHGYTDPDFRADLKRQMAAALMRDRLAAAVPLKADQVHVKQILLYNLDKAQQALNDLKSGTDFNDLVAQYDPVTQGDLGWFPKGYLPDAAIEDAAFALQPGQYSDVIHTDAGYHILFLVERDPAHPLSPDALLTLQKRAVADWLAGQRNQGSIVFEP